MSCKCLCSVALPSGAMDWSAVCDCVFYLITLTCFLWVLKVSMTRTQDYKTWVHSQTQNKAQWLAAYGHVSESSQSLRFILSLILYLSSITLRPGNATITEHRTSYGTSKKRYRANTAKWQKKKHNWAMTCDFQQCDVLTSVNSDEPVKPPFKIRNSKWCSVSSLTVIEYSSD